MPASDHFKEPEDEVGAGNGAVDIADIPVPRVHLYDHNYYSISYPGNLELYNNGPDPL